MSMPHSGLDLTSKCNLPERPVRRGLLHSPSMNLRTWLSTATHPATARRAAITALIVGVILTVINHGPALLAGQVTGERIFQILLTVMVPYTVSTISSVATRHEMSSVRTPATAPKKNLCIPSDAVWSIASD